jgi:hypothetical protein
MKVFKSRSFSRFAREEALDDAMLLKGAFAPAWFHPFGGSRKRAISFSTSAMETVADGVAAVC